MFDVCVIGHLTQDIVIARNVERKMPGGTAYYSSIALKRLGANVCVVTKTAKGDIGLLNDLISNSITIFYKESQETTIFKNIYPKGPNFRLQEIKSIAQSFKPSDIPNISTHFFHLGPLTKKDISIEILRLLSKKAKISLDVQGFVRKIDKDKVKGSDWEEKEEGLTYINVLKASETEAKILSGENAVKKAAIKLSTYGIDEIIITCGRSGSLIYSKGKFYPIPYFLPRKIVDTTGCGDTYIAAYIHKHLKSRNINEAGRFAAATAALKTESFGPFKEDEKSVQKFINYSPPIHF
ncbi:MAG: PfkB family carbohydrate kinase [Candidatus Hermodarchaeota archaeon]